MQPLIDNFPNNSADALAEGLDRLAARVANRADRLKVGGQQVACSAMTATVLAGGLTAIALPAQVAHANSSGEDVIALQQLLADNGFSPGPIDGVLGPATTAAIESAQSQLGLTVDGIAGPQTLAALNRGSSGAAFDLEDSAYVTQIQRLLTQNGFYDGPITGFYGPLTREAVTRAQVAYGLTQDGIAGPLTLAALQGGAPSSSGGTATADSDQTRQLQTLLTQRGFYSGPLSGIYGPLTEAAVREAQRAYGLAVDGIAGPLTLAALQGGAPSTGGSTATGDSERNRQLQVLLTQRGFYTGPLSGIYGPLTEAAVRRAQAAYGLAVDGIGGTQTLAALQSGLPPVATVPTPTPTPTAPLQLSQAELRELQLLLQRGGFYTGPLDGVLGTQTRTAVAAVQRALQLVPDGQPTPTLLATLRQNVPAAGGNVAGGSGGGTTTPAPGGGSSNVSVSSTLELQQLLAQRDFYLGPLDGRSNETLTAAIRRAQNWYGLTPVDGRPSPELISRLETDRYAKVS